jgi:hypothetical protein
MTYNERVQAIAEEMARENEPGFFSVADLFPDMEQAKDDIKRVSNCYIHLARIAVKYMAEAYKMGFNGGWGYDFSDESQIMAFCDRCIKMEGLIPDNK